MFLILFKTLGSNFTNVLLGASGGKGNVLHVMNNIYGFYCCLMNESFIQGYGEKLAMW